MRNWLSSLQPQLQFFSESEAWTIFRLAAIGEAVGWTLLISGIAVSRYIMHGNQDPVVVAGQLHGTLFIVYVGAVLAGAVSLSWSRSRTIVALAASVPPYGSLVFEHWAARQRELKQGRAKRPTCVYGLIYYQGQLLALQPASSSGWQLPGGQAVAGEPIKQALGRQIYEQTGVQPAIGDMQYLRELPDGAIELYFWITNAPKFGRAAPQSPAIDECQFIASDDPAFPDFLRRDDFSRLPHAAVTTIWR